MLLCVFNIATDASFFNIDSTTGEMSVKTRIDREGAGGRTTLDQLRVTVTDSSSKQATLDFALTVVDVNDNPPVFNMSTYVAQVTENSPAGNPRWFGHQHFMM